MHSNEQHPFSQVVETLKLSGDRALESNWHRHTNPDQSAGGWVENYSTVDNSVFVGPGAIVWGEYTVVSDGARVFGEGTWVGDGAEIFGEGTLVCEGARGSGEG